MIVGFFGVPRVGKNTMLTMIAQRELKRMKKGRSKYKHVYSDFYCDGCEKFDYKYFRTHKMYDSLILIDEMGLEADNRNFKRFTNEERDFFVLHGHLHNDIIYATQDYSKVDSKIRALTEELWYLSKSCVPVIRNFTFARRIFRNISINDMTSELVMGYRFANVLEYLFSRCTMVCFRPLYYSKFDSHEEAELAPRPILCTDLWNKKESSDILSLIA